MLASRALTLVALFAAVTVASSGCRKDCTFASGRTCADGDTCQCDDGCNQCSCKAGEMRETAMACGWMLGQPDTLTYCELPHPSSCRAMDERYDECNYWPATMGMHELFCEASQPVCPAAGCVFLHDLRAEPGGFWCCPR
jgi:hypothetical protein